MFSKNCDNYDNKFNANVSKIFQKASKMLHKLGKNEKNLRKNENHHATTEFP